MKRDVRARALRISFSDNVAIALDNLGSGETIQVADRDGTTFELSLLEAIPFAHKVAVQQIKRAQRVVKYGESIGVTTSDIAAGQHVHTQNLVSQRAARKK